MTENSRRSWQALLRRAPLWVLMLVFAVIWSAVVLGLDFLQGEDIDAADVVITGAGGLVVATFALWFGRRVRAKELKLPPGSPTGTNITRALSTGQLPEKASAEKWVPELSRIIRQERHMVWIGPLMCLLFAALGVFLIFETPARPWLGVLCTPFFLGLAIWFPVGVRRRRARIQELLAQFPEEGSSWP
ncbi:MAG: hypothetical protein JWO49_1823 [Arthrobacter sp.]|nr:hypothetical protein [Arthrobacter sp.]